MSDDTNRDEISGVETTGHEWDGLKELNNPAPRWWLLVFLLCCVWALGYWVVYPAWPTLSGNTQGSIGWTQYNELKASQSEIEGIRGEYVKKIQHSSLQDIQADPELRSFAIAGGRTMFMENCAGCHGTGAQGGPGYPNLNDDDWLWGGDVDSIYKTLKFGVRSGNDAAHDSQMPAFMDMLKPAEIASVAEHVLSLSAKASPNVAGKALFAQNCASCHGADGLGDRTVGAPNLADAIWLYGSDKHQLISQISRPRHGVMPSWESRLTDETIKQLSIYVHSLGGGEAAAPVSSEPVKVITP